MLVHLAIAVSVQLELVGRVYSIQYGRHRLLVMQAFHSISDFLRYFLRIQNQKLLSAALVNTVV